jgi:hypothetical protein
MAQQMTDPRLQKHQAAKAARRERAIMRKEIHENNPSLTEAQLDAVIDARIRLLAQQAERDAKAQQPRSQRSRHRDQDRVPPKVEIANRSLAIGLADWLKK